MTIQGTPTPYQCGQFIRNQRVYKGMTQEELADAAKVSRSHLSLIETGRSGMSFEVAFRLAKALDVAIADMIDAEMRGGE